jgi:hypothetical protein
MSGTCCVAGVPMSARKCESTAVNGRTATDVTRFTIVGDLNPDGSPGPPREGIGTRVLRKRNGRCETIPGEVIERLLMTESIVHAQRPPYERCQVTIPPQGPRRSSRRAPRQILRILLALCSAGRSNGHFNGQRFVLARMASAEAAASTLAEQTLRPN